LPQSYAAVVYAFLQEGDIETAVAVYAANRRAEVSSEKSWAALTTALFSTRDFERAVALLKLVRLNKLDQIILCFKNNALLT